MNSLEYVYESVDSNEKKLSRPRESQKTKWQQIEIKTVKEENEKLQRFVIDLTLRSSCDNLLFNGIPEYKQEFLQRKDHSNESTGWGDGMS